jgi:hypothetical protein
MYSAQIKSNFQAYATLQSVAPTVVLLTATSRMQTVKLIR